MKRWGRKSGGKKQENIILCNNCGRVLEMKIHEQVIDYEADGKEIREQYLECSQCKKTFSIIILDEYTRKKRMDIRSGNYGVNKKQLMEEMQIHQEALKQKYGRM